MNQLQFPRTVPDNIKDLIIRSVGSTGFIFQLKRKRKHVNRVYEYVKNCQNIENFQNNIKIFQFLFTQDKIPNEHKNIRTYTPVFVYCLDEDTKYKFLNVFGYELPCQETAFINESISIIIDKFTKFDVRVPIEFITEKAVPPEFR